MFPRTISDLTIRPGFVAKEFIRGIRVKYYGPVGYFFLMTTLMILLLSFLGLDYGEMVDDTRKSMPVPQEDNYFSIWTANFVSENVKLVMFLGVPLQGIAARYFFHRKSGYRFVEHLVLPFYLMGHIVWVTMFVIILRSLFDVWLGTYISLLSIPFFGYGYITFSTHQSKVKSFFKGIGIFLVGQLLFVCCVMIVAIAAFTYLAYFEPETFNLIRTKP